MYSFTKTTVQVLVAGALVLGTGIFYQSFASYRVDEVSKALPRVDAAQRQADEKKRLAEQYVRLIAEMAERKIDRQEPLSVVSEFSPSEISQIGPLLGTLYQRDGSFFLERFELTWREANKDLGLRTRVALDLDGRKVLLFSNHDRVALSSSQVK